MRRTATAIVGALLVLPLLAACSGGAGDGDPDRPLQVAVGDGSLRAVGDDCAGTAPYRHIHAGAEVVLTDAAGNEAFRATLAPGVAQEASDIDFEQTPRIPTICVFTLDAGNLPGDETYDVVVGDKTHGSFTYMPDADGIPTILIPEPVTKGTP